MRICVILIATCGAWIRLPRGFFFEAFLVITEAYQRVWLLIERWNLLIC